MTINQIAEICNVSKKTVSRVINNEPNVKEETRNHVLQVIKKYNYRPNVYARNMNKKATKNILISVCLKQEFSNTAWIQQLLNHLTEAAQFNKFRILVETFRGEFNAQLSALNEGGMIDAVVIFYEQQDDPRIELAKRYGIPAVTFGRSINNVSFVANANTSAILNAYDYLFSRKLYRSTLILGDHIGTNIDRAQGAKEAYRLHNIDGNLLELLWDVNTIEEVQHRVQSDIANGKLPDVYFISGDEKALGIYNVLQSHNLTIPDDTSVIGFDNIPISQYLNPPLTTVAQNFKQLSLELIEVVKKIIEDSEPIYSKAVPMELIIRESTK